MAVMDALLKIKASVEGDGAVAALSRSLGSVQKAGQAASKSLKDMAGAASMGGLAGAMSALTPLLSVAGLIGMAKAALDAGNHMHDLSQRTGVSVEMLAKFKKAAAVSGTSLETVTGGLARLSKSMAAAASSGFAGRTKEEIDRAVDAVRTGEEKQVDLVRRKADQRITALEQESDQRMRELSRRYRQEERLLNDKYDDQAARDQEAADAQLREQERSLERQFELRRKAIEDDRSFSDDGRARALENLKYQEEDQLRILRDGFAGQRKERERGLRDAQQLEQDALDDRRNKEETALRAGLAKRKGIIKDGLEAQIKALKDAAEAQIKLLKGSSATDELSQQMEDLGLNGKQASEAFQKLGVQIKNSDGTMRSADAVMLDIATKFKAMPDGVEKTALAMKLFGRSGAEMIPMLNMGGDAIEKLKVKMTTAFADRADEYKDKLVGLGGKVGALGADIAITLLPILDKLTDTIGDLLDKFNSLDPFWKKTIVAAVGIAMAWGPLVKVLGLVSGAFNLIGSALALLAPLVAPVVAAMVNAFVGFLVFLGADVIPVLIGFFSGPVGWTVLAIAAVVGMCWAFREPIGKFLSWLWDNLQKALKFLLSIAYAIWVKPWVDLWNNVLRKPIADLWGWMVSGFQRAVDFVKGIWSAMVNGLRSLVNGFVQGWVNSINFLGGKVSDLIAGFNKVSPIKVNFVWQRLEVPKFAEGAVVDRPTLAMIGEGGEREYVIPESKMAAASSAYLASSRGQAATGKTAVNITTGPVLEFNGQRYVTLEDLERSTRAVAEGVIGRLRTPSARLALGLR